MQAQTTSRQPNNVLAWVIAGLGVILMVLLLLSFMADSRPAAPSEVAGSSGPRIAFLQFGLTADALRVADPADIAAAETLLTIPHAAEYGALPSISPDATQFAYNLLPETASSPGPDSPAELWATVIAAPEPRLLAEGVDLLVPPIWTPDGQSLVYRRTTEGAHSLAMIVAGGGGEERVIASSETEALFPVGFQDEGSLLYVGLDKEAGSRLYRATLATGEVSEMALLSEGLTREWTLSPDRTQVAFLEIAFTESEVASRASVVDVMGANMTPLTSVDEAAFGPTWSETGQLAVGTFDQTTRKASLLLIEGESHSRIEGPALGFDVPLAYNAARDAYVVSSFENDSITVPGRSTLTLVSSDGQRTPIAEGEVTLVGWTQP